MKILPNEFSGRRVIFNEQDVDGAAADGFDANRAGTSEKINELRAGDLRAKNVEERFAETVAGGAQRRAVETLQDAAAISSGDDAHGVQSSRYGPIDSGVAIRRAMREERVGGWRFDARRRPKGTLRGVRLPGGRGRAGDWRCGSPCRRTAVYQKSRRGRGGVGRFRRLRSRQRCAPWWRGVRERFL